MAEHKVDGSVIPRTVILVNGPQFQVELYRDPAVTEASGGRERHITYPIRANGVKTFLYEENGRWVGVIMPFYPSGKRGRPPKGIEKMLRMYLLQIWFNLSDEGTEDAI